jgi:hypothetical protein
VTAGRRTRRHRPAGRRCERRNGGGVGIGGFVRLGTAGRSAVVASVRAAASGRVRAARCRSRRPPTRLIGMMTPRASPRYWRRAGMGFGARRSPCEEPVGSPSRGRGSARAVSGANGALPRGSGLWLGSRPSIAPTRTGPFAGSWSRCASVLPRVCVSGSPSARSTSARPRAAFTPDWPGSGAGGNAASTRRGGCRRRLLVGRDVAS